MSYKNGEHLGMNGAEIMDESRWLLIAKDFILNYYQHGDIEAALTHAGEGIVVFGTQSMRFAVGHQAAVKCLVEEYARLVPCLLKRHSVRLKTLEDGSQVVMANVILKQPHDASTVLHRLVLMFEEESYPDEPGSVVFLTGIHMTRDLHHEATYRMVSANMMHDIAASEGKLDTLRAREAVPTYVSCAYIAYRLRDARELLSVGEDLLKMLGYKDEAEFSNTIGRQLNELVVPEDRAKVQNVISRQLLNKDTYQAEYRMQGADGSALWVLECGHRSMADNGQVIYHSVIMDISPLKQASENLIYKISYDEVTHLYNKAAFYQNAQAVLAANPETEFELMMINIERFKVINELYGEEKGDDILRYFSYFFHQITIPNCVYGRLHSDRFVLLYPVREKARERLINSLKVIASSFSLGHRIVLDFGVYGVTDKTVNVSVMCDRAQMAMLKARRNAFIDCGEYDEEMRRHIMNESMIVNEMNEALDRGEFRLYLQPKFNLENDRPIGAEALVRWQSSKHGLISPVDFIPVFEQNGFIFKLDKYIWEETCKHLRRWLDRGQLPLPVSVNVSRVDFYNPELITTILNLVRSYQIDPSLLDLELTESAYTENPDEIIAITKELQSYGFHIHMDDFGSGYSSLNMLKDMPVDVLKIDLRFLENTGDGGRGRNILTSVVRMAKWLDMPVVVEGVETEEQVGFLRSIGCEYAQGYYYAKPLPVADYEILLRNAQGVPVLTDD